MESVHGQRAQPNSCSGQLPPIPAKSLPALETQLPYEWLAIQSSAGCLSVPFADKIVSRFSSRAWPWVSDKQAFGNGGVQGFQSLSGQQCFEAGQGFGFQDFRNDQGLGHSGNPQGSGRGRGRGSGGRGSNDFLYLLLLRQRLAQPPSTSLLDLAQHIGTLLQGAQNQTMPTSEVVKCCLASKQGMEQSVELLSSLK